MPYKYLEEIATADVAFEVWGETVEEMFVAAADATMNVMVSDLQTISNRQEREISVESESMEMLLFDLLQELIFFKDAEKLLLRVQKVHIQEQTDGFLLHAWAYGEELDPGIHDLIVDVKAVTLHHYRVEETSQGWKAQVILDI
jgi:SHS2 domain-containing protein